MVWMVFWRLTCSHGPCGKLAHTPYSNTVTQSGHTCDTQIYPGWCVRFQSTWTSTCHYNRARAEEKHQVDCLAGRSWTWTPLDSFQLHFHSWSAVVQYWTASGQRCRHVPGQLSWRASHHPHLLKTQIDIKTLKGARWPIIPSAPNSSSCHFISSKSAFRLSDPSKTFSKTKQKTTTTTTTTTNQQSA